MAYLKYSTSMVAPVPKILKLATSVAPARLTVPPATTGSPMVAVGVVVPSVVYFAAAPETMTVAKVAPVGIVREVAAAIETPC